MTLIDQVRALIPDTDADNQIFTDAEIEAYLLVAGDNPLRAAAFAIEANASVIAENYINVRTDDLAVNGAQAAEALLKRAGALREEADRADAAMAQDLFTVVYPRQSCCAELAECRRGRWC